MLKRFVMTALAIIVMVTTANAGMLDTLFAGHRMSAGDIAHGSKVVYLNYCVRGNGYNTGIRITPDSRHPVKFYVFFFNAADPYDFKDFYVGPEGWTGLISDLLNPGVVFRSPSNVIIISSTTADNKRFWIDQFIFSQNGFGFVQLESKSEL